MKLVWTLFAVSGLCCSQTPVIVISLDTLRADRIGTYGNKTAHTPNLDRWASEGTVYEDASSPVPLTLPAHTALMTSTYPFENGVESNAGSVPHGILTLASVLKAKGYRTGAFVGSIFLEKQLGLDAGFDTYDSPFDFGAFSKLSGEALFAGKTRNSYSVRERRAGPLVLRAANQWLAANAGQPVFAFIHLFDMHKPWAQPTYDAQLMAVDAMLGNLRLSLERSGWWDRALIVVTADHGEGLGDHGESDHGYFIYQSTVHVPLIVHWPKGDNSRPGRVKEPVGLVDVAPTVLDYLKIPKPTAFHGRSFLDNSPRPVITASVYARDSFGWAPLQALRAGSLKYIDAPRPELYDVASDPGEHHDLSAARKADAARLRDQLLKSTAPVQTSATADPRKNEALKSLGYIAPGPRSQSNKPRADPKDRLQSLIRYDEALGLMAQGRTAAAITILNGILASDAANLLVRRDLGVALIELKQYEKAIAELRTVAAAAPDDYVTRYELGSALEATKRLPEALDQYRAACAAAPGAQQCAGAVQRLQSR